MRLAIFGATGRMGLAITRLAKAAPDLEIVGGICSDTDPGLGRDMGELAGIGPLGVVTTADVASGLLGADVVIDFSTASAVASLLAVAPRQKVAVVSGTTNIDEAAQKAFDKAALSVPVMWAPNMSLGVQVLAELVERAVKRLGLGYDVEITEIHHRKKIDSPSGTAKRLAEAARAAATAVCQAVRAWWRPAAAHCRARSASRRPASSTVSRATATRSCAASR